MRFSALFQMFPQGSRLRFSTASESQPQIRASGPSTVGLFYHKTPQLCPIAIANKSLSWSDAPHRRPSSDRGFQGRPASARLSTVNPRRSDPVDQRFFKRNKQESLPVKEEVPGGQREWERESHFLTFWKAVCDWGPASGPAKKPQI